MDEHHNRGSPRLQFTKEELENDALSRPIARAEKAADKADAARKKLKKHYRLKLSREEAGTVPATEPMAENAHEPASDMMPDMRPDMSPDMNPDALVDPGKAGTEAE